jgi:hypothetical protein
MHYTKTKGIVRQQNLCRNHPAFVPGKPVNGTQVRAYFIGQLVGLNRPQSDEFIAPGYFYLLTTRGFLSGRRHASHAANSCEAVLRMTPTNSQSAPIAEMLRHRQC